MLIRTISQYLESHKRLVVPQLGTFIVKEPGVSIVFSELLKRDDGTLRRLLIGGGLSELEAAGEIDRFVFEVRHAVEHGAEFRLDGFGVMKPGPEIFRIAEQAAGARAEDCVYVGDSYSQDVAGAGGCGWETVWLNRRGDAAGELAPTYCVKTEEDLLAYLKRMA